MRKVESVTRKGLISSEPTRTPLTAPSSAPATTTRTMPDHPGRKWIHCSVSAPTNIEDRPAMWAIERSMLPPISTSASANTSIPMADAT